MEVINRLHKDIEHNVRVALANYMRVEKKEIYFSAGCNFSLGIMSGLFIHFINDDDRWLFYANGENDGFPTVARKGKNSSLIVSASLCSLFLKRTMCSPSTKFPIVMTKSKMKDSPIYEILINKAFY
jgi:hypothetical protein